MTDPKTQLAAAAGLIATPWWTPYLENVHQFASTVAVVAGAIVGIIAAYRAIRGCFTKKEK